MSGSLFRPTYTGGGQVRAPDLSTAIKSITNSLNVPQQMVDRQNKLDQQKILNDRQAAADARATALFNDKQTLFGQQQADRTSQNYFNTQMSKKGNTVYGRSSDNPEVQKKFKAMQFSDEEQKALDGIKGALNSDGTWNSDVIKTGLKDNPKLQAAIGRKTNAINSLEGIYQNAGRTETEVEQANRVLAGMEAKGMTVPVNLRKQVRDLKAAEIQSRKNKITAVSKQIDALTKALSVNTYRRNSALDKNTAHGYRSGTSGKRYNSKTDIPLNKMVENLKTEVVPSLWPNWASTDSSRLDEWKDQLVKQGYTGDKIEHILKNLIIYKGIDKTLPDVHDKNSAALENRYASDYDKLFGPKYGTNTVAGVNHVADGASQEIASEKAQLKVLADRLKVLSKTPEQLQTDKNVAAILGIDTTKPNDGDMHKMSGGKQSPEGKVDFNNQKIGVDNLLTNFGHNKVNTSMFDKYVTTPKSKQYDSIFNGNSEINPQHAGTNLGDYVNRHQNDFTTQFNNNLLNGVTKNSNLGKAILEGQAYKVKQELANEAKQQKQVDKENILSNYFKHKKQIAKVTDGIIPKSDGFRLVPLRDANIKKFLAQPANIQEEIYSKYMNPSQRKQIDYYLKHSR